jgi:hypothetical protein
MTIEARLTAIEKKLDQLLQGKTEEPTEEFLTYPQAMALLNRSRSWLHIITVTELEPEMDVNRFLIKEADWFREGNRILYKKDSLLRIKDVLREAGNAFDEKRLSK